MKNIIENLKQYLEELNKLINEIEIREDTKTLKIDKRDNKEYYRISDINNNRYARISDLEEVSYIVNTGYYKKTLPILEDKVYAIKKCIKTLESNDLESVYDKLSPSRKKFVDPLEASYEIMLEKWLNKKTEYFDYPNELNIVTKNGEKVRSKSELILADTFYDLGIKYKYEKKLVLKDNSVKYPDFTFLAKNNTEIYWEHFGLMDDATYVNKFIRKIKDYERNDIKLWDNLIVTFESSQFPFDNREVIYLAKKYLL